MIFLGTAQREAVSSRGPISKEPYHMIYLYVYYSSTNAEVQDAFKSYINPNRSEFCKDHQKGYTFLYHYSMLAFTQFKYVIYTIDAGLTMHKAPALNNGN